jgi:hypothetical protein
MSNGTESQPHISARGDGKQQESIKERLKRIWKEAPPFQIAGDTRILKSAVFIASQCKTQLEAALVYASYGVPVFPCNWKLKSLDDPEQKTVRLKSVLSQN